MKRCTKCGIEKPEDAFGMQASRGRRRAECRECKKIADRAWLAKRRLNPPQRRDETKQCNTCHLVKPVSEFSPGNPGYFHGRCKACEVDIHQKKRQEQYQNDPTGRFFLPFKNGEGVLIKRCTYCFTEKPLSEFYANGKKGRHGKCKDCDKTIKKANYDADPEKYREAVLRSMRKHRDRARARYQRWHALNYERRLQNYRAYNEAHRVERCAYDRVRHSKETPAFRRMRYERRRQVNPHKNAEYLSHRRARMLRVKSEKFDRKAIIERDNWTCYLCGQVCTLQNVTLDHVIPLFHHGAHAADNLRVACRSCNSRKGVKLLHDLLK